MQHVFGLWWEAEVPRENPRIQEENMQTLHRGVSAGIWARDFSLWGMSD